MRRIITAAIAIGIGGMISGPLFAHEEMKPKPSSPELNLLKQLQGQWTGTKANAPASEKAETVSTAFKVTSAGSAVEETLGAGTPHEMVDMYVDEGGKLAMTHYCAMGNQPHLVLKKSDPKSITLEMGQSAGIDAAKDTHMHTLVLEMPDANHLTERWTSLQGGKTAETVVFNFTRK